VCDFVDRKKYPERPMLTLHVGCPSVYLLGWREGDFTDIHDHGSCEVGVYGLQGMVTEDIYATRPARRGNRECLLTISRNVRQGDLMTCPANYIHRVGNIFPEVAATLHVYGPALNNMCLYDALANDMLKFRTHWRAGETCD
jgi:predicted metal-dependent enzyme (double-stranded beta helix superfamily)